MDPVTFRLESVTGWNQRVEPLPRSFVYQRLDQMSSNWSVASAHDQPAPGDAVGIYLGNGLVLSVRP